MRGRTVKTPERVRLAQQMRAEGFTLLECAEHFGARVSTISAWTTDPDGERLRARKDSYCGECESCGGPTYGGDGPGNAPTVCIECLTWTPDAMKAWVLDYFKEHGFPPKLRQSPWSGVKGALRRNFGTWNDLLLACGLPLACDRRRETQDMVERRLAAGESVASIARDLGVTPSAIHMRMRTRGRRVSEVRAAA